jgi:hypothetical protein
MVRVWYVVWDALVVLAAGDVSFREQEVLPMWIHLVLAAVVVLAAQQQA